LLFSALKPTPRARADARPPRSQTSPTPAKPPTWQA
jgi:hypothetical protein